MSSNLKSRSQHSSSSSESPHFLNPMEIEGIIHTNLQSRDLFDQLLDQNTIASSQQYHYVQNTIQTLNLSPRHHQTGCKCSKIDCLKLYCQCFAKGKLCNSSCQCVCCNNTHGNQHQIFKAKQVANFRHPGFFQGIPSLVPIRKCTCKKSLCQKKYCECFSAGLKCTQECECINCHNQKPQSVRSNDSMSSIMEIEVNA